MLDKSNFFSPSKTPTSGGIACRPTRDNRRLYVRERKDFSGLVPRIYVCIISDGVGSNFRQECEWVAVTVLEKTFKLVTPLQC